MRPISTVMPLSRRSSEKRVALIGIALAKALNLLVLSLVLAQIFKADRVDAEILSGALAVYLFSPTVDSDR